MFGIRDDREKERDCGIIGKGIHGIRETLTGYEICYPESGIRKNFGTESGIAKENGIRDSDERCPGSGMVVKRSGTAGSGTPFPDSGNSLCKQNAHLH